MTRHDTASGLPLGPYDLAADDDEPAFWIEEIRTWWAIVYDEDAQPVYTTQFYTEGTSEDNRALAENAANTWIYHHEPFDQVWTSELEEGEPRTVYHGTDPDDYEEDR